MITKSTDTNSFKLKYRFCLLKSYFEKGYGLSAYLKYMIILLGLTISDVKLMMILGSLYGISCFFVGWLWFKFNWIRAEAEVGNRHNYFQQEMREIIVSPNNRKV